MTIGEILSCLDAELLCGEHLLDHGITGACGSDLMSDVLAFVKEKTVLLTGLTNQHVVRTAEILDVPLIVFVRGKVPTRDIVDMAAARDIALMLTPMTLFTACGVLYARGLRGGIGCA